MNAIFEKHWDALVTTAESTSALSLPAVRLALHLAIRDAHDAGREMWCSDMSSDLTPQGRALELDNALSEIDKLRQERNELRQRVTMLEAMTAEQPGYEEQQNRLMRWLIDNEPEASLACDADQGVAGAVIDILEKQRQAIASYDTALTSAQNEAAMLRQQRADLQADLVQARALQDNFSDTLDEVAAQRDAALKEIAHLQSQTTNANGASLDPTPTPDWGPSHPAWQGLTAEEQETITKLATGAIKFRSVPKGQRLILIGQVLRHIGGSSKITMAQYNSQRPAWMAEATSITQYVESGKWQDVVTVALMDTASR